MLLLVDSALCAHINLLLLFMIFVNAFVFFCLLIFFWLLFQIKDGLHLIVSGLEENSAGKTAGMAIGDQIVKANGVEVTTVEDLTAIVEATPLATGGALELDVVRRGKQNLKIKLLVDDRSRKDEAKKQRYLHV